MTARATMNSDSIYSACSNRQLRGVRRKLKVAMIYATECKKALLIKKRTVVDNSKISTVSHITNMCFFIKGEKKMITNKEFYYSG